MENWQRWLGWYLNLPQPVPGEAQHWRLTGASLLPSGWPPVAGLALLAAIAVLTLLSYRQETLNLKRGQRVGLVTLRLAALAVALLIVWQPALTVARSGQPSVAVLIDHSESMATRDPLPITEGSGPGSPRTNVAGFQPSRLERIVESLTASRSTTIEDLSRQFPVKFYPFAEGAQLFSTVRILNNEPLPKWRETLQGLQADGRATRPAEAVRQVLAELRGLPPAAMVVLTDGIASESDADELSNVAELVRRRGVRLIVVPVGSTQPQRDLQLTDVVMDEVAFVNDPVVITGKVRSTGLGSVSTRLTVQREGTANPLEEQSVKAGETADGQLFELAFTPSEPGTWELVLEAAPVAGETDLENNRVRRRLSVRAEKLRVLLIESTPRYEFRYLKQWLERDPTLELRTLLTEADPEYTREDRTALAYFPVQKEELWKYDVIILGDVSPLTLGTSASSWLTEYVRDQGGGLLVLAGPRSVPQQLLGTDLELLLPFPRDGFDATGLASPSLEEYRPQLTLDGRKGVPLFRLAEMPSEEAPSWESLPGFYGLLPIRQVKPGVRVLMEHPYRMGEGGKLPVITLQQVGAGKVLFHATDELWRWRYREGDTYLGRYWGQAIRYLSRGRLLAGEDNVELMVDRQTYTQGESVLLRARFLDDRVAPGDGDEVSVIIERQGAGRREVILSRLAHLPSVFEAKVSGLGVGNYHAWMVRPSFEKAPPQVDFRIDSDRREQLVKGWNRRDLELAVQKASGKLLELDQLSQLPGEIPPGRPVPIEMGEVIPLWSRPEPLFLLAGLLVSEWILRRKFRLL